MQQATLEPAADLLTGLSAHDWRAYETTDGPLAGRGITNQRCEDCEVRRTPAAEQTSCPPAWEDEAQI